MNAAVNVFIEKLTLRKRNLTKDCQGLKVHNKVMSNSNKEKYLGDILDNIGKVRATVEERSTKGFAW